MLMDRDTDSPERERLRERLRDRLTLPEGTWLALRETDTLRDRLCDTDLDRLTERLTDITASSSDVA